MSQPAPCVRVYAQQSCGPHIRYSEIVDFVKFAKRVKPIRAASKTHWSFPERMMYTEGTVRMPQVFLRYINSFTGPPCGARVGEHLRILSIVYLKPPLPVRALSKHACGNCAFVQIMLFNMAPSECRVQYCCGGCGLDSFVVSVTNDYHNITCELRLDGCMALRYLSLY